MAVRSRAWCFTINNDKYDDLKRLLEATFEYLVFGFEVGEKGTPHMQGYIYFKNALRQSSVKAILPRAHLEITKGSPDDNYDYCSKDGNFYEFGEKPLQGKAKFHVIQEAMKNPEENFHLYHQYRKAYNEYKNSKKREHEPKLIILPEKDKYEYAKKCNEEVSMWPSEYDQELIRIEPCYTQGSHEILPWLNKMPLKYRVGYEIKYQNPEVLVITYKDPQEKGFLIKEYIDFADEII